MKMKELAVDLKHLLAVTLHQPAEITVEVSQSSQTLWAYDRIYHLLRMNKANLWILHGTINRPPIWEHLPTLFATEPRDHLFTMVARFALWEKECDGLYS